MMTFIFLCALVVGLFIELFQKYVLGKKDPEIEDLWKELDQEDWYNELLKDKEFKEWILLDKQKGLLKDPYYVRKIIDHKGHRDGFITYLNEKAK
ncbi:hypothetical protein [Bacillus sp. NEB1478]|uniref:hypothetical protein n=1 Tax=Bacillus sp. NEB1478 TaxID=3073816 RepID=UPI002873F38E|nr:hypothetical protein [Bacillus sp. NEB1478]WNB91507.1 hypothetical protein RGB74_16645 [Bacillus sp. NEB1478]